MKNLYLFFAAAICCLFVSCKDDPVSDTNYPETLIGKWKWVKTTGGIADMLITPADVGYNMYYTFRDSTVIFELDSINSNYKYIDTCNYTYKKDYSYLHQDSLMMLRFIIPERENPLFGMRATVTFIKDTVWLGDDAVDGQGHCYVRVK